MKCCIICLLIDLFRLCFVVCFVILGSFSNHDGNGRKNVSHKVNSRCFKLHRSYSNSLNLSNVGDFFRSWIYNPGQNSLGQYCNIHIFSVISLFPLRTAHSFRNFLPVLPPPTLYKVETRKNSGYTRPTLFVGWGEGLDLCELENAPEMQKCPKTFVHDCRGVY